jgi:hypothetical protein
MFSLRDDETRETCSFNGEQWTFSFTKIIVPVLFIIDNN